MPDCSQLANCVLEALLRRPDAYLIGIAGFPGSGKTTLCQELAIRRPDAGIISLDGYHIPRSQLDAQAMRCRGAPQTFDAPAFQRDIRQLRTTRTGLFPSFDHSEKDPRPNAVLIAPDMPLVFVEGLYVLMHSWESEQWFDLRVFIDIDLDEAVERLALRHVETGLSKTLKEGRQRAITNDRVNAEAILADGCRERADLIVRAAPVTTKPEHR